MRHKDKNRIGEQMLKMQKNRAKQQSFLAFVDSRSV